MNLLIASSIFLKYICKVRILAMVCVLFSVCLFAFPEDEQIDFEIESANSEDNLTNINFLDHELTSYFEADFSRTIGINMYQRTIYSMFFIDLFRIKTGISFSITPVSIDGYFIELGLHNIFNTGLGLSVKFMGDQYPEYRRTANTIRPALYWQWIWFDAAFGVTWRFLITDESQLWNMFYYNTIIIEPVYYYRLGGRVFLFDGFYTIAFILTNQDEFFAGNLGTFMFELKNSITVLQNLTLFADLIIQPAGSIGLAATWSNIKIRTGVVWQL